MIAHQLTTARSFYLRSLKGHGSPNDHTISAPAIRSDRPPPP